MESKRAFYFSADWCGPCKRTKHAWEYVRSQYKDANIECFDFNYDEESTKSIMSTLGIKTIPTLVVFTVPDTNNNLDLSGHNIIYTGDSKTIEPTALDILHEFSLEEDF